MLVTTPNNYINYCVLTNPSIYHSKSKEASKFKVLRSLLNKPLAYNCSCEEYLVKNLEMAHSVDENDAKRYMQENTECIFSDSSDNSNEGESICILKEDLPLYPWIKKITPIHPKGHYDFRLFSTLLTIIIVSYIKNE